MIFSSAPASSSLPATPKSTASRYPLPNGKEYIARSVPGFEDDVVWALLGMNKQAAADAIATGGKIPTGWVIGTEVLVGAVGKDALAKAIASARKS